MQHSKHLKYIKVCLDDVMQTNCIDNSPAMAVNTIFQKGHFFRMKVQNRKNDKIASRSALISLLEITDVLYNIAYFKFTSMIMLHGLSSTCHPGGNQVDGLPPVGNWLCLVNVSFSTWSRVIRVLEIRRLCDGIAVPLDFLDCRAGERAVIAKAVARESGGGQEGPRPKGHQRLPGRE